MDSFMEIWRAVLDYCSERMNETAFNLWIAPLRPVGFENNSVTLFINDEFKRGIILEKYNSMLAESFEKIMGFDVVIYITTDENKLKENDSSSAEGGSAPSS